MMRSLLLPILCSPLLAHAEFSNPGQYGGFVPPHELEQLQNIDSDNPAGNKADEFDPYFSVENDPWEMLPSPFDELPEDIKEMREDAQQMREQMRQRANRFISPRELEMIENPERFQRHPYRMEPGVWGNLAAPQQQPYPYQGYAPPPMQWAPPPVPGIAPGYSPGFGGSPGYNTSPYIYPGMPGPGMMNNIAPFIY